MERLWQYAGRHRRRIYWGIAMLLFTNLCTQTMPLIMRAAIDGIELGETTDYLRLIALALVLVAAASAVFRTLSRKHLFFAARDVEMDLRSDYYRHLTSLDGGYFETTPSGELMSRATNDLPQVRLYLGPGLLNAVNTTVAYVTTIPLMLMISPKLTFVILMVYPPSLWLMQRLGKQLFKRTKVQQKEMGKIASYVQESLAGSHVIRSFGVESERQVKFGELCKSNYDASINLAVSRSFMWRLVISLSTLSIFIAVFVGAMEIIEGRLTIGDVVAMVEYMGILAWPTFALGWVMSMRERGRASMERINEILDRVSNIPEGEEELVPGTPTIEVKGLQIGYGEQPVLSDIDFEVPAGHTLGIVGEIGSGKTTLIKSLMRLLPVESEMVKIGGLDITNLSLKSLRAQFGYVAQESILFSKPLAQNIAFGEPEATRTRVVESAEQASLDPDDPSLPEGLETLVGERGITLSGGQKQRSSIARALLIAPSILILDDALSAVDSETEEKIIDELRRLREGKTTVIVAHRVSAVSHADQILVLGENGIIESGTHDGLVADNGTYAQLANRQALQEGLL